MLFLTNRPLILLGLLLFLWLGNSQAQEQLPLQFEETDFERNVNRWYQIERENGEVLYHNALYVNPEQDFLLEAEYDCSQAGEEATIGLAWGRQNRYDFRLLELNKKQQYRFGYQRGNEFNVVQPWTKRKKLLQEGKNVVGIQKKGMELSFVVNGKTIYKTTYRRFEYSGVALTSNTPAVRFVRFAIYQKRPPIHLAANLDTTLRGTPKNLGANINTHLVEKSPCISPDGQTLYFVREEAQEGYGAQDIYYSEQLGNGEWSVAKNIGSSLNNYTNNFVNAVLPDNNTLMVINAYERSSRNEILALARRSIEGWQVEQSFAIEQLKKIGKWVSFDLAPDGRTLIFAMQRLDSYGGRDLYVSFLQPNGRFSPPRNLGPTINTTGNEHSPFLAADGKTLYFDTDGHPGYGGRDIFKTQRLDDSWRTWEQPQNLGPTINTTGADEGLTIPASGEKAYFVSQEDGFGGYDIYSLDLPPAVRPLPVALMKGFVVDCAVLQGVATKVMVYKNEQLVPVNQANTHPVTGQFTLALPQGARYTIVTFYDTTQYIGERDTITVDLTHLQSYTEQELAPICLRKKQTNDAKPPLPIRAQYRPTWSPVYFEVDDYALSDSAKLLLQDLADTLARYPNAHLKLTGHTDATGALVYNENLAQKRLKAVREYLKQAGLADSRFQSKGWGERQPVADNSAAQGRAANRRVELQVQWEDYSATDQDVLGQQGHQ